MSFLTTYLGPVAIAVIFTASFAGLAFTVLRAVTAGADAYAGQYSEDTARQFEDIFLFIPPRRVAEIGWTAAVVTFVAVFFAAGSWSSVRGFVVGLILSLIASSVALQAPNWLVVLLRKRRLERFNLQLVDTLVGMSNALKAGFSIMQAFESVVRDGENPIAQEFGFFLQQTRVGVSFSEALRNMEQRVNSEDLTLVVLAIESARITGGNLTEIFEKISATIRERIRIEGRIRTLTAQGRLQGIIVGAMPLLIGIAMMIIEPEMMRPFLHSTLGVAIIAAVAVLVLLGALIIRKIISIDV